MKPSSLLSLCLVLAFALAGCLPVGPTLPSATAPAIPISSLTAVISAMESPTPTRMVGLPSITSSPIITLAPPDTLEPAQAKETLQPLLKEPMNCAVPCFWGIIPGKTRLDEAKSFFSKLGLIPFEGINPNSGKYFYTISYDASIGYDSYVTLHTDNNNLVENIVVTQDISEAAYSPETLIKRYGSPARVEFTVGLGPNIGINMIIYFATSDLIVYYSGYNMNPERFCPLTAPFDFVRLWMGKNPPDTPSFETVPLEKATSLTMDQFTQLMKGDPKKACFAVKEEVSP